MPDETPTPTEPEIPDLPESLGEVSEIHLPGDEEKREAAEAAAAEPEAGGEAREGVAAEETQEPEPSRLDLLRAKFSGKPDGEDSAPAAPDPKDLELAEARQRIHSLYEDRIKELKEQRGQEATAPKDPAADRKQRLEATAKLLAERWGREDLTLEEQTSDLVGVVGELLEMEREDWSAREIRPIREALESAGRERAKHQEVQRVANEAKSGIVALAQRGGTAKELADEFLSKGLNSFLGQTLVSGWDQKREALPPNLRSRQVVEALGVAVAAEIDNMLAEGGANGNPAAGQPATSGLVPKARRAKTGKTTGDEALAEELLAETEAFMQDAYHKLGHDKLFG